MSKSSLGHNKHDSKQIEWTRQLTVVQEENTNGRGDSDRYGSEVYNQSLIPIRKEGAEVSVASAFLIAPPAAEHQVTMHVSCE